MRIRSGLIHFLASLVACLSIAGTASATSRVVVFGDSWGVLSTFSLQQTFNAQAPGNDIVMAAFLGEEAADMNTADPDHGLPYLSSTLAAQPTADLVHLSIGGNDVLRNWDASLSPAAEDALLTRVVDDITAVALHIVGLDPDIEVFHSSYTYIRPIPNGTPLEVNTMLENLQGRVAARFAGIPRATTHSFYGFMQNVFGQSEFGRSPGDPSLPDASLPGPPEAFIDAIHLTIPNGYNVLANEQYRVFYESRLNVVPEPGSPGLLALTACSFFLARAGRRTGRHPVPFGWHLRRFYSSSLI